MESRVKRSDVFSTDELWVLLFSRVVASDYVTAKRRKPILEKISRSFQNASDEDQDILAEPQQGTATIERRDERQFVLLGLISAIMAGFSLWIAEGVVSPHWDVGLSSWKLPLLVGGLLSVVTATLLVLIYWLRERTAATSATITKPHEFERLFFDRLKATGVSVDPNEREIDLIARVKNKRIAIELMRFVPPLRSVKFLRRRLNDALLKLKCDEGYLVVTGPIPAVVRNLNTDKFRVVDVDEFFKLVSEPEAMRIPKAS